MTDLDHTNDGHDALDRLLNGLAVEIRQCGVCSIPGNARVRYEPVDAVTMHYVVAGDGFLQIGNDTSLKLGPDSVVLAPAGALQFWSGDNGGGEELRGQRYCTQVDDRLAQLMTRGQSGEAVCIIRSEIRVTNAGIAGFFDHLRHPIIETVAEDSDARQIFEMMVAELARPSLGSQAVAEGLMRAFLILLLRRHLQRGHASSSIFAMMSDPRLARAMVNVLERPDQPHSLESLAAAAGMSRTAFADKFREVFAQTPNEFIQDFRLKFAANLLTTTSLPIKTVAASVGYLSRSYFSRAFRSVFAMDPSAYRSRHRQTSGT